VAERLDDLTPWLGVLSEDAVLNAVQSEEKKKRAGPLASDYRALSRIPAGVMPKGRNFH
jgi:hypothetical protein